MAVAPLPVALLVAYPIWRTRQMILGNLAGSAVLFGAAIVLILREHAELDRITRHCLELGFTCWPEPSAFTRFAIYAGIALLDVFTLFLMSLIVEQRLHRQSYAPEWR